LRGGRGDQEAHGYFDEGIDSTVWKHARCDDSDDAWSRSGHELHDGAALHREDGKVHRRHEDHLQLHGCDGLRRTSEFVHEHGRLDVQLLLHDERHGGVHLQSNHGNVQMRNDQGRSLHHVHFRRQGLLRHDSVVL
jgi:hypothetical protein